MLTGVPTINAAMAGSPHDVVSFQSTGIIVVIVVIVVVVVVIVKVLVIITSVAVIVSMRRLWLYWPWRSQLSVGDIRVLACGGSVSSVCKEFLSTAIRWFMFSMSRLLYTYVRLYVSVYVLAAAGC